MKVYTISQPRANKALNPYGYQSAVTNVHAPGMKTIVKSLLGAMVVSLVLSVLVAAGTPDLPVEGSAMQSYAQTYL